MSLNSSIFTALSIGALLVACGDSGSGGSGGTSSGGNTSDGGTTGDGGTTSDGGSIGNGGATGAVCADLPTEGADCTALDQDQCVCAGCGETCAVSDCVCPACAGDTETCPTTNCNSDNECDPYFESCDCADCIDHPEC